LLPEVAIRFDFPSAILSARRFPMPAGDAPEPPQREHQGAVAFATSTAKA
jgi:hypothetical protein